MQSQKRKKKKTQSLQSADWLLLDFVYSVAVQTYICILVHNGLRHHRDTLFPFCIQSLWTCLKNGKWRFLFGVFCSPWCPDVRKNWKTIVRISVVHKGALSWTCDSHPKATTDRTQPEPRLLPVVWSCQNYLCNFPVLKFCWSIFCLYTSCNIFATWRLTWGKKQNTVVFLHTYSFAQTGSANQFEMHYEIQIAQFPSVSYIDWLAGI